MGRYRVMGGRIRRRAEGALRFLQPDDNINACQVVGARVRARAGASVGSALAQTLCLRVRLGRLARLREWPAPGCEGRRRPRDAPHPAEPIPPLQVRRLQGRREPRPWEPWARRERLRGE